MYSNILDYIGYRYSDALEYLLLSAGIVLLILCVIAYFYCISLIASRADKFGLSKWQVWFISFFTTPLVGGILFIVYAITYRYTIEPTEQNRFSYQENHSRNYVSNTRFIDRHPSQSAVDFSDKTKEEVDPERAKNIANILKIHVSTILNIVQYSKDNPSKTTAELSSYFTIPEDKIIYILKNIC